VSWILPVHTPDGTRYERVTLMTRVPSEQEDAAVVSARPDQLVAFAREVVALEATASDVGAPAPSNAKATSKPQTKATTKPKTTNVLVPSTTIPPTTPAPTPLTPRPALPKKGGK
jgi:hypothetical protein